MKVLNMDASNEPLIQGNYTINEWYFDKYTVFSFFTAGPALSYNHSSTLTNSSFGVKLHTFLLTLPIAILCCLTVSVLASHNHGNLLYNYPPSQMT